MPDSLLCRKMRGPMANWDMTALMLRNIEFGIRGLQWQNSGKGSKPKPIELPDRVRTGKPAGESSAQRLQNLGMYSAS